MSSDPEIRREQSKKIQILRAFSIIAVVMIHTCALGAVGVVIRPFLNFAVALFLGLSGYLTRVDIPDIRAFYKKRLLRVFLPYTIWSFIYTAVRGTWTDLPLDFVTGYACGAFYYISVYMQLTLLAPLVGRMVRSRYRSLGLLITPAAICFEYVLEIMGHGLPKPYNEVFFPVWFIFFFTGMILRDDIDHGRTDLFTNPSRRGYFLRGLAVSFAMTICGQIIENALWKYFGNGHMAYTQIKLGAMTTSLVVIFTAVAWISDRRKIPFSTRTVNALVGLGNISFGIYLTHILCKDLLSKSLWSAVEMAFPLTGIVVLVVDAAAVLLMRFVLGKKVSRVLGLI